MAEIIACPACQRKLQVPADFFGKLVQCPECKHSFTAGAPAPPRPTPAAERPRDAAPPRYDDEDDRPRRRRPRDEEDGFDSASSRRSRYLTPHRGGMVLTLGILSWVICPIFGPFAWYLGQADLAEIRAGRMDPEGEGMTQAGRILGMVHTILAALALAFYCLIIALVIAAEGGRGF